MGRGVEESREHVHCQHQEVREDPGYSSDEAVNVKKCFYEIQPYSSVKPFLSNIGGVCFLFEVSNCAMSRLLEMHFMFSSMWKRVCNSVLLPAATRRGSWMEETLRRAMELLHTGNSRRKKPSTANLKRTSRANSERNPE